MTTKPDEPAFPELYNQSNEQTWVLAPGLTKRELFAAMAMQGFLSGARGISWDTLPAQAVEHADALLAALNEPGEGGE